MSSNFDIPDPDDDVAGVDELPPVTSVPSAAWFATVWVACLIAVLGVAALWVLAIAAVSR